MSHHLRFFTYDRLTPEQQAQAQQDFGDQSPDFLIYDINIDGTIGRALSALESLAEALNTLDVLLSCVDSQNNSQGNSKN